MHEVDVEMHSFAFDLISYHVERGRLFKWSVLRIIMVALKATNFSDPSKFMFCTEFLINVHEMLRIH